MSILSDRHLNKVSPAAQKDKVKMKRVVVFTDKDPGKFDTDVSENILTDYAKKHTVKKKIGRGYDTGKTKHIIKVPKADYKKNKPLIKTNLSEDIFVNFLQMMIHQKTNL